MSGHHPGHVPDNMDALTRRHEARIEWIIPIPIEVAVRHRALLRFATHSARLAHFACSAKLVPLAYDTCWSGRSAPARLRVTNRILDNHWQSVSRPWSGKLGPVVPRGDASADGAPGVAGVAHAPIERETSGWRRQAGTAIRSVTATATPRRAGPCAGAGRSAGSAQRGQAWHAGDSAERGSR